MVGTSMQKWWWWLMKKQLSLSSRNTLGDTTHNTNKIGLSWDGGSVWWSSLRGSYGGGGG